VSAELMPGWMQSVNDWKPVTFHIEAIRALMTQGHDWSAVGQASSSSVSGEGWTTVRRSPWSAMFPAALVSSVGAGVCRPRVRHEHGVQSG
jgi:hypothetical protein